jgi:hypothetical protein
VKILERASRQAAAIRWIGGAIAAVLLITEPTTLPAQPILAAEPPPLGAPGCPWPQLSGQHLLERRLGRILFANTRVSEITRALVHRYGVPLSFIEASSLARVTVALPSCTLRQLLDKIVTGAPTYRYGFLGPHLVLYSTEPQWQTRIEHIHLPTGGRLSVSIDLVKLLRSQVPALARFQPPGYFVIGNPDPPIYGDPVQIDGPATVMELFAQLLGQRTSAVFSVASLRGTGALGLDTANLVNSLKVTASKKVLSQSGETVQLRVTGLISDGTLQDLTSGSCGTSYTAMNARLQVSRDGLVTAISPGTAMVFVGFENEGKLIRFEVAPPGAARASGQN